MTPTIEIELDNFFYFMIDVSSLLSYLRAQVSEDRGSIRTIKQLNSVESDVEIVVSTSDASVLTDKDEGCGMRMK
ncbi:hypothetical protein TNCV_2649621 [Trichonephila clavipes]|nr:hypothetical protein TNCV_2649621 [Trichonephila clavipes]